MSKHTFPLVLAMALVAMALVTACFSPAPAPTAAPTRTVQATAASEPTAATPGRAETATPKPANPMATPQAAVQPGTAGTLDRIAWPKNAGLDKLASYHLTLRRSFSGTQNGQKVETSTTYERTYRQDTPAQFTTAEITSTGAKPVKLLFGYVGAVAYQQAAADQPCTASAKAADLGEWNPGTALRPVAAGKLVGRETVNGISTRHYELYANSFAENVPVETSGDLYLADTEGYVVKYVLRVKAGETYFGKGNQGEETTAIELLETNGQKEIALPAGCPGLTDLPAMPGAADVKRTPWDISYLTASTAAQVIALYRQQMPALGWELKSSSEDTAAAAAAVGQMGAGAAMSSTAPRGASETGGWMLFANAKTKQTVYVTLKPEGGKLRVQAQIGK